MVECDAVGAAVPNKEWLTDLQRSVWPEAQTGEEDLVSGGLCCGGFQMGAASAHGGSMW
jgi:hypothetical protein